MPRFGVLGMFDRGSDGRDVWRVHWSVELVELDGPGREAISDLVLGWLVDAVGEGAVRDEAARVSELAREGGDLEASVVVVGEPEQLGVGEAAGPADGVEVEEVTDLAAGVDRGHLAADHISEGEDGTDLESDRWLGAPVGR
jgi:hypothetical protein